jgi:glucokinase
MPAGCVIGVDLGGTKLLAGVVDPDLNVHHRAHRWARGSDASAVLEIIVGAVREVRDASEVPVRGVGLGIPSLVDQSRGTAVSTVHYPLTDVPIRDVLAERLGLPIWLDNDANCALLAEHRFGAAAGASHALMYTLGTGIGGAVIVGGQLVRGVRGGAGELGHMTVSLDGPQCPCGSYGCLEVFASGNALGREGLRVASAEPASRLGQALASGRDITGALVTELAHDGDELAIDCVSLIGSRLGEGVRSMVNALNPEVVVIGGGVIGAGEMLLAPVRAAVSRYARRPSSEDARVVAARFGEESGMLGAAILAQDGLAGRATAAA